MASKNGMFMRKGQPASIKEGLWWEEHCIRRQGGYDLDISNLPAAFRWLPKGAVLAFNAENGKAIVVKTAKVYEAALAGATSLKIEANDLIAVGDVIGGAEISAISTEDGVSTLTVSALEEALAKGAVIADDNANGIILGLAYETTDLMDNDYPQVTPTLQAFEIEEDTLPFPINDDIKKGLGALHQFKIK